MAGLGMGVLVVEAPRVSGALSTAHAALESGKEVFVVPGSIYSSVCTGSNRLLIEGACPVVSPVDIIDAFQWILVEEEEKAPELDIFHTFCNSAADMQALGTRYLFKVGAQEPTYI